jgi:hypothetical protein
VEPRKRKRLLLAFAGIVAFVAGLFLVLNHYTEPTYNGRPLSEWIAPQYAAPTSPEAKEARIAIKAIGTSALPYLLEWITYEHGDLRRWARMHEYDFPNWLQEGPAFRQWLYGGFERAYHARAAFAVLGDQAIPAIPELHRLACTADRRDTQIRAAHCLFNIGPAATAALTNVLATTYIANEPSFTERIESLGTNAAPFVPILVHQLKHGSWQGEVRSAETLGALQLNPEEVIPALIDRLADPHPEMRAAAAKSLAQFGTWAIIALPALNQLVNDPERRVSAAASNAITAITGVAPPEADPLPIGSK